MDLVAAGEIIDERFEVLSSIGSGGMGSVVKATQLGLNRTVALKVLRLSFVKDSESLLRFEREAKALATLNHQHIGAFYSYGFSMTRKSNTEMPYIVMEFLEGPSLMALIQEKQRLPWKRAVSICIQIAEAMEHVHEHGLLHRDLKPSNVILLNQAEQAEAARKQAGSLRSQADFVKVVDFGLAKFAESEGKDGQKLTHTGELLGTVQYMSPEQCMGHKTNQQSDIYSLAVILFECLVGIPPHQADSPIGVIYKCLNEPTLPASSYLKEKLPVGCDALLQKALARDPAKRYQSMSELKSDLKKIEAGEGEECIALLDAPPQSFSMIRKPAVFLPAIVVCIILAFVFLSKHEPSSMPGPVVRPADDLIAGVLERSFRENSQSAAKIKDLEDKFKKDQVRKFSDTDGSLLQQWLPDTMDKELSADLNKKNAPLQMMGLFLARAEAYYQVGDLETAEHYAQMELLHRHKQAVRVEDACLKSVRLLEQIARAKHKEKLAAFYLQQVRELEHSGKAKRR